MTDLSKIIEEKYRKIIKMMTTICKDFNMTIEEIEKSQGFELCFFFEP